MLGQIGETFSWRRAFACPCVSRNSGQPNSACVHCAGKGRLWGGAVAGEAGTVSRSKMRDLAPFGMFDQDDIMLSIPSNSPLYEMGQYDRIAALNKSEPFSQNVVRGLNDVLRFDVLSVDRVFYYNAQDVQTEIALPTVNADGTIVWEVESPPAGVTYSITGRRIPEYYCYMEIPTDRPMQFGDRLPRRVTLRRFDLYGR